MGSVSCGSNGKLARSDQSGVGFVSITEALDLTTPTGRAMTGMLAVFAQFEGELLVERVRAGMAQTRKDGKLLAGRRRPGQKPRKSANSSLKVSASRKSPSVLVLAEHPYTVR